MVSFDAHIHIALDGADYNKMKALHEPGPNEAHIRSVLSSYHDAGITFLRDGGDKWGCSLLAKSLAPEYGIDYRTPDFAIYKKGSYGSILGRPFRDIGEFKELVSEVKKNNCDFVKIMGSGIMDFNAYGKISECTVTAEEMSEMIKISHDAGFAVMVHCNGDENIRNAAAAGADSIEHGYYMKAETLELLKEKNTFWVPTVIPVASLAGAPEFKEGVIKRILQEHIENIHKAAKLGLLPAPGSDGGSYMTPHKESSIKEYTLLSDILHEEGKSKDCLIKSLELMKQRFRRGL